MALVDDLIITAKTKLIDLQGSPDAQDVVKKQFLDLAALKPDGLANFIRASIDLRDFANVIDNHRAELRPWIMVYPAAMGLEVPWASVLNLWARKQVPADAAQINGEVVEALESLFSGYVRMIAI